jgi:hypothetical protein
MQGANRIVRAAESEEAVQQYKRAYIHTYIHAYIHKKHTHIHIVTHTNIRTYMHTYKCRAIHGIYLRVRCRVPGAVHNDYAGGCREIQSNSAGVGGDEERLNVGLRAVEAVD